MRVHTIIAALAFALLPPTAGDAPPPVLPAYVALGDSYASGAGTFTGTGACNRSNDAYPALYKAARPTLQLSFDACMAASTATVRARQLDHLDAATTLVTITVGAVDADFGGLIIACLFYDTDGCAETTTRLNTFTRQVLPDRLATLYGAIHAKAPNAKVIALGYPRLWGQPNQCPAWYTPDANQRQMNSFTDVLNKATAVAAAANGVTFVDVTWAFADHGICSPAPWVNGFTGLNHEGFHPNALGHKLGYLPLLDAATRI